MYLGNSLAEPAGPATGTPATSEDAARKLAEQRRDELLRVCSGVEVLQRLDRFTPAARVAYWEWVLTQLPYVLRLKAELAKQVREGRMNSAKSAGIFNKVFARLGYPAGYALGSEADEMARARCSLAQAQWRLCASLCFNRVPGLRALPSGADLGEPPAPDSISAQPRARTANLPPTRMRSGLGAGGFGGEPAAMFIPGFPRLAEPPASTCSPTLDATANAIVSAAQNPATPLEVRAVQAVWRILRTYYPGDVAKVSNVVWSEPVNGLVTTRQGTGERATGVISVGRQFIEHTTAQFFARRVLQVGHELRHIDQYRAGLIGRANQAQREFMAHCWTALQAERPGTGCVSRATRLAIIDCALGFYNCMPAAVQSRFAAQQRTLLRMRANLRPTTPWPPAGGTPACPPPNC